MEEKIRVQTAERDNFTVVPNILFSLPLPHAAFRLYCWFRKVCGEDGACWQSITTLTKQCQMKRQTVVDSRRELEQLGLIEVEETKTAAGNRQIQITLLPIWERNVEHFRGSPKGVRGKHLSTQEGESERGTRVVRKGYAKKIPEKKITKSALLASPAAESPRVGGFAFSGEQTNGAVDHKPTFAERSAQKLYAAVAKRRKLMNGKSSPARWASTFLRRLPQLDRKQSEIERLLDWYIEHFGEQWVPEIYSAEAFFDKYVKLEAARLRQLRDEEGVEAEDADDDDYWEDPPSIRESEERHWMEIERQEILAGNYEEHEIAEALVVKRGLLKMEEIDKSRSNWR